MSQPESTESPANVPVVDPARVARYVEAIVPHTSDGYDVDDDPTGCWCKERLDGHRWSDHLAEVVVAVADAELAEVTRLTHEALGHGERAAGFAVVWRLRAEAAEAKVAAVEALAEEWERDETLHEFHEDFEAGIGWPPGTFFAHRLRAALAAASSDGGLDLSDEEFAGFQAAVKDEPATEWCDDADPKGGRACHLRRGHTGEHTGGRHSWPVEVEGGE